MDAPLLALTRRRPGGMPGHSPNEAAVENMRQLIQLRWLAVVGQLIAILAARFGMGVGLPLLPMVGIVLLLALANLVFTLAIRKSWTLSAMILPALLLDMAALTAQLYLSGGATNPFISLYLLQVVLGAILLESSMVWLLAAASCLCAAFLSVRHWPLQFPSELSSAAPGLMLVGEWVSFAMVAILLVLFITRISRNLRARDDYVAELGQRAAEEDGIVRMGLFASGAAHELGTPLSTLAVLISDWQRHPTVARDEQFLEELSVAQTELGRCKQIVSNILDSAGRSRGEAMGSAPAGALLESIVAEWQVAQPSVPLDYRVGWGQAPTVAAEPALRQAIWSLLENAAEASPDWVELCGDVAGGRLVISVSDRGAGFPKEQLARIGEPHQSTKGPGHGLGLFLASNVARRLGGSLEAANRPGGGAVVRLSLPLVSPPATEEA